MPIETDEAGKPVPTPIEIYLAHVDQCDQCRNHIFHPCPVGAKLLILAR